MVQLTFRTWTRQILGLPLRKFLSALYLASVIKGGVLLFTVIAYNNLFSDGSAVRTQM